MNLSLTQTLDRVEKAYSGLRGTTRLVLAAAATTRLSRQHPLAVILVGGPSSGKTSLLMPLTRAKKDTSLGAGVLRVDEFSPASLVSHSANATEEKLQKIDLLPKMKGRCVVVKEMAPVFTGKEDELNRKFGVLASVLDGEGYVSSSGVHGQRGYDKSIVFTLLGAVTPAVLSLKVIDCMNAIGPRFNFWDMPERVIDAEKWRGPGTDRKSAEQSASEAIIGFLDELFSELPPGSVDREEFDLSGDVSDLLSACALLMALGRSKVIRQEDEFGESSSTVSQESPERAYRYLEQIALGSALLEGRKGLEREDYALALGLAIGSALPSRKGVLRVLFDADRPRSVQDFTIRLEKSDDSIRRYLVALSRFGLIEEVQESGTKLWDLRPQFQKLRRAVLGVSEQPSEQLLYRAEQCGFDDDFWSAGGRINTPENAI